MQSTSTEAGLSPDGLAPLIPDQRQQKLLQLLRAEGMASTRTLIEHLGVSHMTVRRDIATLEAAGLVVPIKGGVRLAGVAGQEPPRGRQERAGLELPRKAAIARAAAQLVTDSMVIYLDAGTTCQAIVPLLIGRRDLTVVTNDFLVATSLLTQPTIRTIHTGGAVDAASGSSCGWLAARTLSAINIDRGFLSTGAWSVSRGVTSPSEDKVELKQAVMTQSSECVLVADSTKYGSVSTYRVAALDQLDVLITDDGLAEDTIDSLSQLGVDLQVVPAANDDGDRPDERAG